MRVAGLGFRAAVAMRGMCLPSTYRCTCPPLGCFKKYSSARDTRPAEPPFARVVIADNAGLPLRVDRHAGEPVDAFDGRALDRRGRCEALALLVADAGVAIQLPRPARDHEAGPGLAKALLQALAQCAGEQIARDVRCTVEHDARLRLLRQRALQRCVAGIERTPPGSSIGVGAAMGSSGAGADGSLGAGASSAAMPSAVGLRRRMRDGRGMRAGILAAERAGSSAAAHVCPRGTRRCIRTTASRACTPLRCEPRAALRSTGQRSRQHCGNSAAARQFPRLWVVRAEKSRLTCRGRRRPVIVIWHMLVW